MNTTSEKLADALRDSIRSIEYAIVALQAPERSAMREGLAEARAALAAYDAERRAETEEEMLACTQCGHAVDPLAVFPGGRCIDCYRPEGDALARSMTADKLTELWGGRAPRARGRRR